MGFNLKESFLVRRKDNTMICWISVIIGLPLLRSGLACPLSLSLCPLWPLWHIRRISHLAISPSHRLTTSSSASPATARRQHEHIPKRPTPTDRPSVRAAGVVCLRNLSVPISLVALALQPSQAHVRLPARLTLERPQALSGICWPKYSATKLHCQHQASTV